MDNNYFIKPKLNACLRELSTIEEEGVHQYCLVLN